MKRKRRKRTNSKVPAKGRLRDMADQLWSLAVKDDWANKCAICGNRRCESHHLIPRQYTACRYNLQNGIALCGRCHQFDPDHSPHQNAAGWLLWLEAHHPRLHDWLIGMTASGVYRSFQGRITPQYYCEIIQDLKQYVDEVDYDRIVGIRFGQWLEEQEN